jgi:hypothetical protein
MTTRRSFLKLAPLAVGACALAPRLLASAAAAPVEENDPAAAALGYKKDASAVDPKKFAQFKPGSTCANCALYTGKAGAETGPCMALANRPVSAKGWCMVWAKKP